MRNFVVVLVLGMLAAQNLALSPRLDLLPFETAPGPCPKPKTASNFDPASLVGTWYDIKRYKNTILKGSCGTADFTWNPNNSSFHFPYTMKEYKTNVLDLTAIDINNGKFKTILNGIKTPFDFWLLDIDAEHYHVAYTCIELVPLLLNSQSLNIFARTPQIDPESLGKALVTIEETKLDATILRDVVQDATTCGRN